MAYLALYRAWRPQSFGDVTGQKHITKTLQNALLQDRFSHAYLFSGPRGVGKTSIAKIFAKAVNCKEGRKDEPCNACPSCIAITNGELLDVSEIDAASNRGVDEIRDLREQVRYAPTTVSFKVIIIDEVHMLTNEAFNALLKTLEEPPEHVIFVLATTEPHKLPLTIISRCQRFDFQRIEQKDITERLVHICNEQNIEYEQKAIEMIAYSAEGGLRDALSLLDQIIAFGDGKIKTKYVETVLGSVNQTNLINIIEAIVQQDIKTTLEIFDMAIADGKEPKQLVKDLIILCRDLLLLKVTPDLIDVRHWAVEQAKIEAVVSALSEQELMSMLDEIAKVDNELRYSNQSKILVEILLIQLCRRTSVSNDEYQKEILKLQTQINQLMDLYKQGSIVQPQEKPAEKLPSRRLKANLIASENIDDLKQMHVENNTKVYEKIKDNWQEILEAVKKERITVHAWLADGELVAVYNEFFVIAFNGAIHRETTDMPANRQLIESVIMRLTGKPFKIKNIMLTDWNKANIANDSTDNKNVVVDAAIELFGAEFVEIVEED